MDYSSLIQKMHPCVSFTLISCATLSLYVTLKGVILTCAAASTAHKIILIAGIYLCIGTFVATRAAFRRAAVQATQLNPNTHWLGLYKNQALYTMRDLLLITLFYPIVYNMTPL